MKQTIHINLKKPVDNSYDIQFGVNLNSVFSEIRKNYSRSKIFIITDSNVNRYYNNQIQNSFDKENILIIPPGEKSKTRQTKEYLEDKLLGMNISRDSLIIAFGGGVVGDITGFVASTVMRGIQFIQIPTSLLSQVDSSIGGKVAVDHPLGKNLIGAFYQPKKVYININVLKTLPEGEFRSGMAEVIKYAAIIDKNLFSYVELNHKNILNRRLSDIHHVVKRCCEIKKIIVEKDEKESGPRMILNFGHTIGHAVESLSNYKLTHGEAVAIGMVAEAKISSLMDLLRDNDFIKLKNLLELYKLPTKIPSNIDISNIVKSTLSDKKVKAGDVRYTLLRKIGHAVAGVPIDGKSVQKFLSA